MLQSCIRSDQHQWLIWLAIAIFIIEYSPLPNILLLLLILSNVRTLVLPIDQFSRGKTFQYNILNATHIYQAIALMREASLS